MASLLKTPLVEAVKTKNQAKTAPTANKMRIGYAALAILFVIGLDCAARAFYQPNPYNSPNRSWIWWAVKDYIEQPNPDVAIFGSSLMLAALNDGDSTFVNRPFDAVTHHRGFYLEHLLSQRLTHPIRTASFAIGGQMASDVYAIANTIFTRQPKPKTIIWGIAPRDFLDSSFTNPDNSETVRFMDKVSGSSDVLSTRRRILWDRVQNVADRAFYIYGKRQDLVCASVPLMKSTIANLTGQTDLDTVHTPSPLLRYAMLNMPEDNGIDQWRVTPYSPSKVFQDNTAEYTRRYNPFNARVLQQQLDYFERFLRFTTEQHISVVLVNMPLTQDNLKLLPAGAYDGYLNSVQALATKYGAQMLDFDKPGLFASTEFADTVHLNGLGGKRFFEMISEQLAPNVQKQLAAKSTNLKGSI